MQNKHFFAVDIGASSGRTILGTLHNNHLETRELTRFTHPLVEVNGHFYWNILSLYESILDGLKVVARENITISSIGIDTWGVDFVAIDKNQELIGMPYAYRDPHTTHAPEELFKQISRKEVYQKTGIQIMNFNSLFQLFTLKKNNATMLNAAEKIMFMPDALSYLLTGKVVTEYTIASTSQMLNPYNKTFDSDLLKCAGLNESHFGKIVMPGTVIGNLSDNLCKKLGLNPVPVVAVAGHDTASAIAAVPAQGQDFAYLSSGTWSLMGVELPSPIINEETFELNFTNEGGVDGTIRFLKNICGMWLLEQCRREWSSGLSYEELIAQASASRPFRYLINPDAGVFANPPKMLDAIADYCQSTGQGRPETVGEYVRCIFESLALRYKEVLHSLQDIVPSPINNLHVIGGGSKNNMLNQFTANALGIRVTTGPSEATAIGNIMLQAKAMGVVKDLPEIRRIVCNSIQSEVFMPTDTEAWNNAYNQFKDINHQFKTKS